MAARFAKGSSLFFLFRHGYSVQDSQYKPRYYLNRDRAASHSKEACGTVCEIVEYAPVIHAEWEWFDELNGNPLEGQDRDWGWRCSACKTWLPNGDTYDPDRKPNLKYCPECGAKMDGGEKS